MNRRMTGAGAAVAMALALPGVAGAEPFLASDARALGMGGAGVAVARGTNAAYYNPALASPAYTRERLSITFPSVGFSVADRDDFIDALDDFDDSNIIDRFDASLSGFNSTFELIRSRIENDQYQSADDLRPDLELLQGDLGGVQSDNQEFQGLVAAMSDKPVTFDARGAVAVGARVGGWGTSYHAQARGYGGGVFLLDEGDFSLLNDVIGVGGGIVSCLQDAIDGDDVDEDRLRECRDLDRPNEQVTDELGSTFRAQGVVMRELGFTLARDFDFGGRRVSFGITPKAVEVDTYDYIVVVQDEDDVSVDDVRQRSSNMNIDIGLAAPLTRRVTAGLVVRNLVSQDYGTVEGNVIALRPQARAGLAWQGGMLTLAADLDLTENRALGFGPKTRFLSLGTEIDLARVFQLRFGYRTNLSSSDIIEDVVSAGFGLSPGPFHFDLGVAGSSKEAAAYFQTGLRFGGRR
jgi:hypothetical protein